MVYGMYGAPAELKSRDKSRASILNLNFAVWKLSSRFWRCLIRIYSSTLSLVTQVRDIGTATHRVIDEKS